MSLTTHLSLVSPDRNALLDVVEGAEAAFLEYGLAPDIGGVQAIAGAPATSDGTIRATDEDALPDHFSSELLVEIDRFDADSVHYAAIRGLPVVERVVREEVQGRSAVVIQSSKQTGAGPKYRVYRYDAIEEAYETVSKAGE
ncbi:hypothetical protein C464_16017 [Halorubrum coriense DSM 10284]|uniref:Uncharacterized protein n=1 Tax=Halorubrum coriense DSM 10284 TaxID=1227466 RepID=M0E9E3_9EURY|nr:hypothetical protein [Halorubrum coriense]ELZ43673.1 hypothetical protein C464_16017 [Halorubrum coriense DSM 10284]